uniref:Uncharacterized protein n=1 Tax=Oryza nivara TaxID=4536 RepID=A0A0E0FLG5_ORYNI
MHGAARLRRDSDGDGTLSSPAVVSSGGHLLPGEFLPFPSPLASSSSVRVSCARATAVATATAHDGDRHGGGRHSITPPHGGAVEALALRQGEAGGHGSCAQHKEGGVTVGWILVLIGQAQPGSKLALGGRKSERMVVHILSG